MKTRAVLVVAAALVSGACATMIPVAPHVAVGGFGALKSGSDGSDSEKGVGGHVVAGPRIGQTSLLGLLGFTRLSFTGGHDNIISAGAQVRQRFGLPLAPNPWIGLEGTWMRETSVVGTSTAGSPTANGYTVGGLVGVGIPAGAVRLNVFGGASYFHIGDFSTGGAFSFSRSNHTLLRLGGEVEFD